jgi:hypothetical protein
MKKSAPFKHYWVWLYVIGAIIALIVAVAAGLHYFGEK